MEDLGNLNSLKELCVKELGHQNFFKILLLIETKLPGIPLNLFEHKPISKDLQIKLDCFGIMTSLKFDGYATKSKKLLGKWKRQRFFKIDYRELFGVPSCCIESRKYDMSKLSPIKYPSITFSTSFYSLVHNARIGKNIKHSINTCFDLFEAIYYYPCSVNCKGSIEISEINHIINDKYSKVSEDSYNAFRSLRMNELMNIMINFGEIFRISKYDKFSNDDKFQNKELFLKNIKPIYENEFLMKRYGIDKNAIRLFLNNELEEFIKDFIWFNNLLEQKPESIEFFVKKFRGETA